MHSLYYRPRMQMSRKESKVFQKVSILSQKACVYSLVFPLLSKTKGEFKIKKLENNKKKGFHGKEEKRRKSGTEVY